MTRDRLAAERMHLGMPPSVVSFDGPGIGECYAVERRPIRLVRLLLRARSAPWRANLTTESDALRYLLGRIMDDNR
jgi:hypothetical protein